MFCLRPLPCGLNMLICYTCIMIVTQNSCKCFTCSYIIFFNRLCTSIGDIELLRSHKMTNI